MTREEAIKELSYIVDEMPSMECTDWKEAISMAIKALEKEPRWIPVTEKLPEDGQSVLFCDIDDDIMIGYHVKGRHATHFSQDGVYEDMKNVRAWQPLPEPYKGGE